jgi:type II secretory pathway pseudopilin PulG
MITSFSLANSLRSTPNRLALVSMPRSENSILRRRDAFTLIVIAIIAILAGIAFPAMQGALDSAKRGQARNDASQIASAIKAYRLEFGRLPAAGSEIAAITGDNPKKIIFLEAKQAKGGKNGISGSTMLDPWGQPYSIKTDESGRINGHITTAVVSTKDNKGKTISNVE